MVLVLTRLQLKATRISFPNHELSSRKSQAVEIEDEDSLPSQWVTLKTTSQPDKTASKEAFKAGHLILTGAQLVSRRSFLQWGQHHQPPFGSVRCSAGGTPAGQTANTPFD